MFIRLLITSIFLGVVVHSAITNSSKGQPPTALTFPKQTSVYDDYDFNDTKSNVEGSGNASNLDDYADEDENEQLSKVTATTMSTTISTTTTIKLTTTKIPEQKKKNGSNVKTDDFGTNEFDEDYKDDVEDNIDYNEITTESTTVSLSSTRPVPVVNRSTPFRELFKMLSHPPIAAGILAGLAIGILTSVILLICIVQRFRKRERTHSSYTTGLLYPNQYGYSKSPQEFYA